MGRIFNLDNPFMRGLSRMADLMILNLLFIVTSIPIFTIGAGITAMNYVCLKMKEEEEGYTWKNYFKSFKLNFRQATIEWLIMMLFGAILFVEFLAFRTSSGGIYTLMKVFIYAGIVLWIMLEDWLFALQSRFYNTVWGTIRNAVLLIFAKAPISIAMVLILGAEFWFATRSTTIFSYAILYLILFAFAVQTYINSQFIYPVLKSMMPEEKGPASDSEFQVNEDVAFEALNYEAVEKKEEEGSLDEIDYSSLKTDHTSSNEEE